MQPEHRARSHEVIQPGGSSEDVPRDADRPVEDADEDDELVPPLDVPIEAPIDDVIDQRRSAAFDDPDDH